jgi:hypothetical protein
MYTSDLFEATARWVQHITAAQLLGIVGFIALVAAIAYREVTENRRHTRTRSISPEDPDLDELQLSSRPLPSYSPFRR